MPEKGLEPSRPKAQEPKSCVSANFTTPAAQASVEPDESAARSQWASMLHDRGRTPHVLRSPLPRAAEGTPRCRPIAVLVGG